MGIFDSFCDFVSESVDDISNAASYIGNKTLDVASDGIDFVKENPVITSAVIGGTAGYFAAPAIGQLVSNLGLGKGASYGGCAGSDGGLAWLGGGSLESGGTGVFGGTTVVTGVGAATGAGVGKKLKD